MLINFQWITRLKLNLAINLLMEFVWFVLFVTLRSQTKASPPPPKPHYLVHLVLLERENFIGFVILCLAWFMF
jgi:hypothetical protein